MECITVNTFGYMILLKFGFIVRFKVENQSMSTWAKMKLFPFCKPPLLWKWDSSSSGKSQSSSVTVIFEATKWVETWKRIFFFIQPETRIKSSTRRKEQMSSCPKKTSQPWWKVKMVLVRCVSFLITVLQYDGVNKIDKIRRRKHCNHKWVFKILHFKYAWQPAECSHTGAIAVTVRIITAIFQTYCAHTCTKMIGKRCSSKYVKQSWC